MYKVYFYTDRKGKKPVGEYIAELSQKGDKDSRIKLQKIQDYINALREYGLQLNKQ